MRPTEKAEVDQLRQARAVGRAVQSTDLIKGDEFPTIQAKASYGEDGGGIGGGARVTWTTGHRGHCARVRMGGRHAWGACTHG